MTGKQIPKLSGSLVEHQAGFSHLTTEEAEWAIRNMKTVVPELVKAIKQKFEIDNPIFGDVSTINISPSNEWHFGNGGLVHKNPPAEVHYDDFFDRHFLFDPRMLELEGKECSMDFAQLNRGCMDSLIINTLGGKGNIEVQLNHVLGVILTGSPCVLNHSYSNIFYVIDLYGKLEAVHVSYSGGSWDISSYPPSGPVIEWDRNVRVFWPTHSD